MVLILESRTHLDLGDLPNLLAAELGVMTVRLERAIRSLDGVARVHVNRWGDGSAHLHMWFLARPYGRLQLRGTFLSLWDSILPPISEAQWRENLALVAAWLAEFGGRPLAEPPRIQWQAPSSLLAQSAAAHAAAEAEAVSVIEAAEEIPEPASDITIGTDGEGDDDAVTDAVPATVGAAHAGRGSSTVNSTTVRAESEASLSTGSESAEGVAGSPPDTDPATGTPANVGDSTARRANAEGTATDRAGTATGRANPEGTVTARADDDADPENGGTSGSASPDRGTRTARTVDTPAGSGREAPEDASSGR
ncbi:hypothetical protein [Micromonospora sp. WMMD710]|uniref:hypothetical protein n=1 Tax=Micromonospora sp. WMMD710 TaxID=3016085 RepID=UPI00241657BA|nr:hypothetical protein [Micromonospora sp. WMMD710]MDG4761174.1 hypothetical protein [Micromonospora sp. WMMD710]